MKFQEAFICPLLSMLEEQSVEWNLLLMVESFRKVLFLSTCFSTVDVVRIFELNWDPVFSWVPQCSSHQIPFFLIFMHSHWSKLSVNVYLKFILLLMTYRFTVKLWQDYCLHFSLTIIKIRIHECLTTTSRQRISVLLLYIYILVTPALHSHQKPPTFFLLMFSRHLE